MLTLDMKGNFMYIFSQIQSRICGKINIIDLDNGVSLYNTVWKNSLSKFHIVVCTVRPYKFT